MRFYHAIVMAFAVAATGAQAQATPAFAAKGLSLDAADVARLGVATAPLKPARYTPQVHGYGVVLDITQLAQADAAVETAQAAAKQSGADVARARALFAQGGAVSRQSVDAAEKQASSDQAALVLAQRQEIAQFGSNMPWRGAHANGTILRDLSAGRAVLVRATFPLDSMDAAAPTELSVTHLSAQADTKGWSAKKIWAAPADPTIPGKSYFALLAKTDLQPGEHVLVYSPTGPASDGVEIPSDAIVLSQEKTWCYLQTAPGTFRRMMVNIRRTLPHGYFAELKPGTPVVVKGAGLLLAREFGNTALHY